MMNLTGAFSRLISANVPNLRTKNYNFSDSEEVVDIGTVVSAAMFRLPGCGV
jgi:hypothetical protein